MALMSSISRGSLSSLIGRSVHRGERQEPRATMLSVASGSKLTTSPPLPGELLAELLPLVGEINAVLDPEKLLPAIAQQLRRIVDYHILDIFLPQPDGSLAPAFVAGYSLDAGARFRVGLGEGI